MRNLTLSIIAVAVLITGCGPVENHVDRDTYVSLFNGRDLEGWVIENDALFSVQAECLVVERGVGWLRSKDVFGDIILEIDFRFMEEGANSGIFVRTGMTSHNDDNGWPDNGYQVQCMDRINEMPALGTMIPYGAPPFTHKSDLEALAEAYLPSGQWNHFQITCQGEDLRVKLNGTLITTANNIKNHQGHIGIQAEHGLLEFRNISVQRLSGSVYKTSDMPSL